MPAACRLVVEAEEASRSRGDDVSGETWKTLLDKVVPDDATVIRDPSSPVSDRPPWRCSPVISHRAAPS